MRRLKYSIPVLAGIIMNLFWRDAFWETSGRLSVCDIVLQLGFGTVYSYVAFIAEVTFWYIPLFMAHVLFGRAIYKRFCSASVYYFSRTDSRLRWYAAESARLYADVFIYMVLFVGANIVILSFTRGLKPVSAADIIMLVYYLAVYSMFLFITSQCINLLSIRLSGNIGFVLVELVCLGLLASYTLIGDLFGPDYITAHPALVRLNPACHLITYIHSSKIDFINVLINGENIKFNLGETVWLMVAASVLVMGIGCLIVRRTDIIRQGE